MSAEANDHPPPSRLRALTIVPILAAIAFVLGFGGLGIGRDTTPRIHDLRNPKGCTGCHVSLENLTLVAAEPKLCYDCHADAVTHGASHPIDIPVPNHADPRLPLKDGKMNCSTCHDAHGKASHAKLLRRTGNDLCLACHKTLGSGMHGGPNTKGAQRAHGGMRTDRSKGGHGTPPPAVDPAKSGGPGTQPGAQGPDKSGGK